MPDDPLTGLRDLILEGERSVISTFQNERRLDLVELARAMDFFFVGYNFNADWAKSEESGSHAQLVAYGLHKALYLLLDESTKHEGAPLFRSTPESQKWADSMLAFCGKLGYCEYLLELQRVGLIEITRVAPDKYHARPITTPYGVESFERENLAWTRNLIETMNQGRANYLKAHSRAIKDMMFARVDAWMTHYIEYTTSPEIDAFYQAQGLMSAQIMLGSDSFPREAKFGGQEFGLYCAVIATLVGWSEKHLGFCFELLKKHPCLEPRNILTITVSLEDEREWLSAALEVDRSVAQQVIDVVTLTLENKKEHCSVPGNLITPVFIEIGENKLLQPIWSSLSEPFVFLLRELRRRYRSDWDNAVNGREQVFRDDLYALFPSERFYKLRKNAILRIDGAVITDIDAFVLDRQTGDAGVFQLKWQDFIGNSMRDRESKKANLLNTGNQWIERVLAWLSGSDKKTLAQTLKLNASDASKVRSFRVFVVGRNSAFFSGDWRPDTRAAWGMWHQLLRLISGLPNYDNPIEDLFRALQDDSPLKRPSPEIGERQMKIGNVTIAESL